MNANGGLPVRTKTNFRFSFAELIILTLLEKKDIYGYEFVPLLETVSGGRLIVTESTLYPTLYKLLDSHYISDREERAGKRRIRVYYHLEPEGLARLNHLREEYQNLRDDLFRRGEARNDIFHGTIRWLAAKFVDRIFEIS